MTVLNFPSTTGQPTDGSFTYIENGVIYTWNGSYWAANNADNLDTRYVNVGGDTMTGDLTVPSLNGGQLAGMRNAIINGNVIVRQRAETTANSYVADRWFTATAGCGTANSGPNGVGLKRVITIPAAGGFIRQAMELDNPNRQSQFYPNSVWTARVWATSQPQLRLSFRKTSDDITDQSEILAYTDMTAGRTVDGFTEYTHTITIPDVTANVETNQLKTLVIWFQSDNAAASFTGMSFEPGPVATPFENRPMGTELALCQRYFYAQSGTLHGTQHSANSGLYNVWFPVEMRAIPSMSGTITDWSVKKYTPGTSGLVGVCTTFAIQERQSNQCLTLRISDAAGSGGGNNGIGTIAYKTAADGSGSNILFDAEL